METFSEETLQYGVVLHGRYQITEVIGAGGFGITYKAWDSLFQKQVCVKEYYPSGLANRKANSTIHVFTDQRKQDYLHGMKRFLDEARSLAQLEHVRSIVQVKDFFEENNTAYMVMEYLEGQTLQQYLMECGTVDEDIALHIACSVLEALISVHAVGIIHRDISPDNIFLCRNMEVKLIDFGAAKQSLGSGNTTFSVVLKHGFAPVEQYNSHGEQGPWTDIYALGATLYKALTGQMPEVSVDRLMGSELTDPRKLNPNISPEFCKVIMRAMKVKPEDRYQSAEEFMQALTDPETDGSADAGMRMSGAEEEFVQTWMPAQNGGIADMFLADRGREQAENNRRAGSSSTGEIVNMFLSNIRKKQKR